MLARADYFRPRPALGVSAFSFAGASLLTAECRAAMATAARSAAVCTSTGKWIGFVSSATLAVIRSYHRSQEVQNPSSWPRSSAQPSTRLRRPPCLRRPCRARIAVSSSAVLQPSSNSSLCTRARPALLGYAHEAEDVRDPELSSLVVERVELISDGAAEGSQFLGAVPRLFVCERAGLAQPLGADAQLFCFGRHGAVRTRSGTLLETLTTLLVESPNGTDDLIDPSGTIRFGGHGGTRDEVRFTPLSSPRSTSACGKPQ